MKYALGVFLVLLSGCATGKKEPKRVVILKQSTETYLPKASCYYEHHLNEKAKANVVPGVVFPNYDSCKNSEELKKADAQAKQERVDKIKAFIEKYPGYKKFEQAAIKYNIQVGMPEELVVMAMGVTPKVNETKTASTLRKQLVFESFYVYTERGFVVAVQRF